VPSFRASPVVFRATGANFFDEWSFFTQPDPTHGLVTFQSAEAAFASGLAFVRDDGAAVMKVDNSTWLQSWQPRRSVRIESKQVFDGGLFVLDVEKMPHGCSVWPAFWTVGPDWPNNGEIDILEGVHDAAANQMTLHTAEGCTLPAPEGPPPKGGGTPFTGVFVGSTCASTRANDGCAIRDSSPSSYGRDLNNQGGGVFAMDWDPQGVQGIRIWRFARKDIPLDIIQGAPRPTTWGAPTAAFPSASCPTTQFFRNHRIVFDITLCGDWAGNTFSSSGCPGTCEQMVMNPKIYDYAQWVIRSVIVYKTDGADAGVE
jgi:hypothetical protein